jgi:hypothetical protein
MVASVLVSLDNGNTFEELILQITAYCITQMIESMIEAFNLS